MAWYSSKFLTQRESAKTRYHFAEQECIELSWQVAQSRMIPEWRNGEVEFNKGMQKIVTVLEEYAEGMLVSLSWWIEVAVKSGVGILYINI